MSSNSPFSFTLIRKTLPIYSSSSSPSNLLTPLFLSHAQFLPFKNSAPLSRFMLSGDAPEFPQRRPILEPSVPLEVPQILTRPEIDPTTPPELPPITPSPPGPEFPVPPAPSPPGIDVPIPPHKPPDIEPPKPGSPVPGPDILPPLVPEELPPRPAGPEILTSPSSPDFVPPMALF